jgi:hypothetical protein
MRSRLRITLVPPLGGDQVDLRRWIQLGAQKN